MSPFFCSKQLFNMKDKTLICPTCSGQMMLTEAKPGDKIAKCEYCNTIVDLPETIKNQSSDLSYLKNSNTATNPASKSKMLILIAVVVVILMMGTVAIIPLLLNR